MEFTLQDLKNWEDLKKYFPEECADKNSCYVAAEGLIFDSENRLILHRRGPKCRDERYKLEGIGGRIEKNEEFIPALMREISEEAGDNLSIRVVGILEVRKDTVYDHRLSKEISWLIISYICVYIGGEFIIKEPEKNLGFEKVVIGKTDINELSSSSKAAYIKLIKDWENICSDLEQIRSAYTEV